MSMQMHTNIQCLALVARHHGVDITADRLVHDYSVGGDPVTTQKLLRIAKDKGLRAKAARMDLKSLGKLRDAFPVLAELNNGNWVVVANVAETPDGQIRVGVIDPLSARPEALMLNQEQFERGWNGNTVLLKRVFKLGDSDQPFGIRWFIPEIIKQRSLFRDVAIAALVLYGLGLVTPIFFQLVIDKVLAHQSYATLTVLTIGIVVALLFEAIFTFLRRYMLLYATNKVDVRVSTRTFSHLLSLPIALFEHAPAGLLIKHMQQASRIREFLTGR
jgi:ATP-binding cassette subfamily B protein